MTLKRTKIALFVSLLFLPIGMTHAFAQSEATSEIAAVCGFSSPGDVPFGMIIYGFDTDEVDVTIDVEGTSLGTLELEASDWRDVRGDPAQGYYIVGWAGNNNSIEVNGLTYYAVNAPELIDFESWHYGGSDSYIANQIADVINARDPGVIATSDYHDGDYYVYITAAEPGIEGNSITISENVINGSFNVSGPTLTGGGENGTVHMESETTKYNITVDGTTSSGIAYAEKTPIEEAEQILTLTEEAFPGTPINLSFQISGNGTLQNMPFAGAVKQTWLFTYSCTE